MNQEIICQIGKWLTSHSDFKYDPCDSTAVYLHLLLILVMTISIPLCARYFSRQRSQNLPSNNTTPTLQNTPSRSQSPTERIITGLLPLIIIGVFLGYAGIATSWFGIVESVGITALVICIALPLQSTNTLLNRLRTLLFMGGFVLVLVSTNAASSMGFNSFAGWIIIVCFWTVLSIAKMNFSVALNEFQSRLLLLTSAFASLTLGYVVSIYFPS